MAKWIRKVKRDKTNFRVSIPRKIVRGTGWESCEYVTVEHCIDGKIIIRRLPGDEKRECEGTGHIDRTD